MSAALNSAIFAAVGLAVTFYTHVGPIEDRLDDARQGHNHHMDPDNTADQPATGLAGGDVAESMGLAPLEMG